MSTATERLVDDGIDAVETLGVHYLAVVGRVVPYDTPADIGLFLESFQRGAFTKSIVTQPNIPLLLWHDNRSFPIGHATSWDDRPDGLHAQFKLALTPVAQVAGKHIDDGFITGLSIGFQPTRSTWRYTPDWNPDLGPDHMDHVTRTEARLIEVSLTPTPAYVDAFVTSVQSEMVTDQS
jgi:HK97 family phage prohead protease